MDKLQPIIKHHFWILFLVALVLPPIAWSMTTGSLDEQTQTREDDLNSTLNGVVAGQSAPNDDWKNQASMLVNVRKESNKRAWDRLWNIQTGLQIWPDFVRPYMETCPYRGTPADVPNASPQDVSAVMATVPNLYRDDYEHEIERVWRIPEPVSEQTGMTVENDAPQKVLFPSTVLPRVPKAKWMAAQPTWMEMWNAQEDLWLMSELLKAIRRVNADATSIADANVRQIQAVQLFGGTRAAAGSSGSSAGSAPSGEAGMMGLGYPGGMTRRGPGGPSSAEFALSEEYDVKDAPTSGGGGFPGSMAGGAAPAAAGSDPQADENRYIKQEWAYRTRGFKLRLSVHQMYVPEVISELLKSDFPVEIVRFQQSALNPDRPGGGRGATGGYAGTNLAAGGGGYPGGGYPGAGENFPGSYPGSGSETESGSGGEGFGGEDAYPDSGEGFNPYGEVAAGGASGAAAAKNAVNSAVVAAALSDVDLMDLVIVGEIYLYNQPDSDAAGEAEAAPADGADPGTGGAQPAAPMAGAPQGADPSLASPAVQAEEQTSTSPAALTGEVTAPGTAPGVTLDSNVEPAAEGTEPADAAADSSGPVPDAAASVPATDGEADPATPSN